MAGSGTAKGARAAMLIGTDIIEIDRTRRLVERYGDLLIGRVFTEAEWAYCMQRHVPWPSFAARFAAKEAVAKAFGTGFTLALKWTSVEVCVGTNGMPLVQLDALGMTLLKTVHATTVHLSLSHCKTTAIAVALIE